MGVTGEWGSIVGAIIFYAMAAIVVLYLITRARRRAAMRRRERESHEGCPDEKVAKTRRQD